MHIDYQFSGLEDYEKESVFLTGYEDSEDDSHYETEYGELSFDYHMNDPNVEVSTLENSMEVIFQYLLVSVVLCYSMSFPFFVLIFYS